MKQIRLFKPTLSSKDYKSILSSIKTGWLTHGKNNIKFDTGTLRIKFSC